MRNLCPIMSLKRDVLIKLYSKISTNKKYYHFYTFKFDYRIRGTNSHLNLIRIQTIRYKTIHDNT